MTPEPRINPDCDDPCDGEMLTLCDSGRSETCSGVPTVTLSVLYLHDPLHVCAECAAFEENRARR